MTETIFAFDERSYQSCERACRGAKRREYYLGDYSIEAGSVIDVRAERKKVGAWHQHGGQRVWHLRQVPVLPAQTAWRFILHTHVEKASGIGEPLAVAVEAGRGLDRGDSVPRWVQEPTALQSHVQAVLQDEPARVPRGRSAGPSVCAARTLSRCCSSVAGQCQFVAVRSRGR